MAGSYQPLDIPLKQIHMEWSEITVLSDKIQQNFYGRLSGSSSVLTSWVAGLFAGKSSVSDWVWMEPENVSSDYLIEAGYMKPVLLAGVSVMHSATVYSLYICAVCHFMLRMHPNIRTNRIRQILHLCKYLSLGKRARYGACWMKWRYGWGVSCSIDSSRMACNGCMLLSPSFLFAFQELLPCIDKGGSVLHPELPNSFLFKPNEAFPVTRHSNSSVLKFHVDWSREDVHNTVCGT
jgi:hypothetical protein